MEDKIVITISRLVKKNGLADLIGALCYLEPKVKLLIIGSGPLEGQLRAQAKELAVDGRVKFLGEKTHQEISCYLRIATVFCRPSLSEGLGISFLEAMYAGLPVIATPVGGIPDFLKEGETGWFCQVRDPESIAEKINYILDEKNQDQVKLVTAQARRMIGEKYSWDTIAGKMKNIFDRLCASS